MPGPRGTTESTGPCSSAATVARRRTHRGRWCATTWDRKGARIRPGTGPGRCASNVVDGPVPKTTTGGLSALGLVVVAEVRAVLHRCVVDLGCDDLAYTGLEHANTGTGGDLEQHVLIVDLHDRGENTRLGDRKSTRLNSSHVAISYAVFCLKQKTNIK